MSATAVECSAVTASVGGSVCRGRPVTPRTWPTGVAVGVVMNVGSTAMPPSEGRSKEPGPQRSGSAPGDRDPMVVAPRSVRWDS